MIEDGKGAKALNSRAIIKVILVSLQIKHKTTHGSLVIFLSLLFFNDDFLFQQGFLSSRLLVVILLKQSSDNYLHPIVVKKPSSSWMERERNNKKIASKQRFDNIYFLIFLCFDNFSIFEGLIMGDFCYMIYLRVLFHIMVLNDWGFFFLSQTLGIFFSGFYRQISTAQCLNYTSKISIST